MRNLVRITIALLLMIGGASTRAENGNPKTQSREAEDKLPAWCLSYFPSEDPEAQTIARPTGKLAPFKLEDMIAPADLIEKTEIVGKLPGYIRKYRGVWIWPRASEPPDFAVFVERLNPKEMTIALLSRATPDNKNYRERLRHNSRQKLTWNGTAFSTEPEGELQSKTTIYISAFGDAMLLISENKREAWPMCFISSKRY